MNMHQNKDLLKLPKFIEQILSHLYDALKKLVAAKIELGVQPMGT